MQACTSVQLQSVRGEQRAVSEHAWRYHTPLYTQKPVQSWSVKGEVERLVWNHLKPEQLLVSRTREVILLARFTVSGACLCPRPLLIRVQSGVSARKMVLLCFRFMPTLDLSLVGSQPLTVSGSLKISVRLQVGSYKLWHSPSLYLEGSIAPSIP